jgi:hypothetical protein
MNFLMSEVGVYLMLGVGVLLSLFGYGKRKERQGEKRAEDKAKEADHENANEIRNRVERDLPQRVRELDDAGFRD